jgi:AcrR family transcriptional regulator
MAEGNRAAVYAAAAELFATRGWKSTGMRDIAQAAGVSVETVYSTAGTKSDLLLRVIDIGIVGDDEPIALADRSEFQALGVGDRSDRLDAIGRLITHSNQRIAALNRTFAHAAAADDELAERWRQSQATQRAQYALGVRMALGHQPRQELVDGIWALGSAEVYLQLVETAGWSTEQYRKWLVEIIDQLLPPTPKERS